MQKNDPQYGQTGAGGGLVGMLAGSRFQMPLDPLSRYLFEWSRIEDVRVDADFVILCLMKWKRRILKSFVKVGRLDCNHLMSRKVLHVFHDDALGDSAVCAVHQVFSTWPSEVLP